MLNYPVERNDNFLSLIASSVRKQIIGDDLNQEWA